MPDYAGCLKKCCKCRFQCSRYMMMVSSNWQSYCTFEINSAGICDGWWPIEDAPFPCYSVKEMEIYEANMENFRRVNEPELR